MININSNRNIFMEFNFGKIYEYEIYAARDLIEI